MRWRLYLEEYSPDIKWLKGTSNIVADALSRLDFTDMKPTTAIPTQESHAQHFCYTQAEQALLSFPIGFGILHRHQRADKQLLKDLLADKYHLQSFRRGAEAIELVCHRGKIVVPAKLQKRVVEWYHQVLLHPGITRTEETIGQHLWWKNMRQHITQHVACCPICQRNKRHVRI